MRNAALFLLVLVLAVLCVIGIGAQQSQKVDKYAESVKAANQILDDQLPIVDFNDPKPAEPVARARRQVKDRRHDLPGPKISEGMTSRTKIYEWPADFPALPVAQSSAIVVGRIIEAKSHVSDDKSGVYTELIIKVDQVLKGKAGIGSSLAAEREGGRVRFPSGSIYRYFVAGIGIPKVGHCYLLFLSQLEDGDFSILTGYELRDGHVLPLDDTAVVPFNQYKDSEEVEFVNEVREAIKN